MSGKDIDTEVNNVIIFLAFEYYEKKYDDFLRSKRSAVPHNETKTGVKFYHVVDEINEGIFNAVVIIINISTITAE